MDRDRRFSVRYAIDTLTIETTAYPGWEQFTELLSLALDARSVHDAPDSFHRVGLRYINEIRVPDVESVDWKEWVNPELGPPPLDVSDIGLTTLRQQSMIEYRLPHEEDIVTLRYGAMRGDPVVVSTDFLVRPEEPDEGDFFLIDTDASWTVHRQGTIPEFSSSSVLKIADRLHAPARSLFDKLITDKFREEVLNVD